MLNGEGTGAALHASLNFEDIDFASTLQYTNEMAESHIKSSSSILPSAPTVRYYAKALGIVSLLLSLLRYFYCVI
jgi:hypothetical protein